MLPQDLLDYLSNLIESKINKVQSVSGGDISSTFFLQAGTKKLFLKINSKKDALDMFLSEEKALNTIAKTNTIAVPKVLTCNTYTKNSFILMEYINAKSPKTIELELFGLQLAQLHQITSNEFGFDSDNFIGSLHQSNKKHGNWNDFYIEERLVPQLQLAKSKRLLSDSEIPEKNFMKEICHNFFNTVKPSLLHGDLWSGNYLISKDGTPFLIDPSTYFGHNEIDIAMSKLFGGFRSSFYDAYHEIIPKDRYTNIRIELYQLYYLLVHLNLFGRSYYSSVKCILNKYF